MGNPYRTHVEDLAGRKIKGFCSSIDEKGNYYSEVYRINASLTESISADYRGRFLIELIQNAYDVHPDDCTNGEIEIVLDCRKSEFGTLYIANRGVPFTRRNVGALCDMGLSSKPPGESIGNKGLGFRSVIHITDTPHIYSQSENAPDPARFAGYCFRFADDGDLKALIPDLRRRELARRDLPLFHVPVWLDVQSDEITEFSKQGFATVIMLPLRDEPARKAVEREISGIGDQKVPMLLFLSRLACLRARVFSKQGELKQDFVLNRSEEVFVEESNGTLAEAILGNSGTYLVARRTVPEADIKSAIGEGISQKQLHRHWRKWKGDGEVAVAVRLDNDVVTPRLYTYLPMGEQAPAPFSGYLHGTFCPTSSRKGLDAQIALNALQLENAAMLAADTVAKLGADATPDITRRLNAAERASAVVDLLCWRGIVGLETDCDLAGLIATRIAANFEVQRFDHAPVVPCQSPRAEGSIIAWKAPLSARRWPDDLSGETFSPENVASFDPENSIAPIWSELGGRINRLHCYLSDHAEQYKGFPTDTERAELAARIAQLLASDSRTTSASWISFYKDLVSFLNNAADALANRPLLLCSDGKLRRALNPTQQEARPMRRRRRRTGETAVFSPPAQRGARTDEDLELSPPGRLAEHFAFLSHNLDWHGALAPARRFLENGSLVLEFDRETVLGQLSKTLQGETRKEVLTIGLRWAFQLWRQPRSSGRGFRLQRQHRFRVPTANGEFIDAAKAVFSSSWPEETQGRLLQSFLDAAPSDIPDLKDLAYRRLAMTKHRAFRNSRIDDWVEFLTELGVRRGLRPVAKELTEAKVPAGQLKNFGFCNNFGIPPSVAEVWKANIEGTDMSATSFSHNADYVIQGRVWWLPGQGDLVRFSPECQELYALLVIAWLDSESLSQWTVSIHHSFFRHVDRRHWPTPLASFLRSAPWVPAEEPSRETSRRVSVNPSDIWIMPNPTDRFPPFLRRPLSRVRSALERATSAQIELLKNRGGLRIMDEPAALAEQAIFLAQQYAREGFDPYFERHLLNLYDRTWRLLADNVATGKLEIDHAVVPRILLAQQGNETRVVNLPTSVNDTDEIMYVCDIEDETAKGLLEASGKPFFSAQTDNSERIGMLFRRLYGSGVRLLSEAQYELTVDGQDVGAGEVEPILGFCPRLRVMAAASMEALKGIDLRRLPADRSSILTRLEQLNLQRGSTLSCRIDGIEISHRRNERRAFLVRLDGGRPVIVSETTGTIDWGVIDDCLNAICEAIGQRSLVPHLRLLVAFLRTEDTPCDENPDIELDIDRFASILRLDENSKRGIRGTLCAGLERFTPWLRAVLHLAGGTQAVDALTDQEAAAVQDIAVLREMLTPWLKELNLSGDAVLEACRSAINVGELQEILDLDFASFNRSLVRVGLEPVTYPDIHRNHMANFLRENEIRIIDALRVAHAGCFPIHQRAPTYIEARNSLRNIGPDPNWLLLYREPPEGVMAEKVEVWLQLYGARLVDGDMHGLDPVEEVRRSNGLAVRNFAATARPLVRAWCERAGVVASEIWDKGDEGGTALRSALEESGVFDFQKLDDIALFEWSRVVGAWPAEMPLSLDMTTLGLAPEDLDEEHRKNREEIRARRHEARSFPFNGRVIDPEDVEPQELAMELRSQLPTAMLSTPLNAQPRLAWVQERRRRGGRAVIGPGPRARNGGAPTEKTDMIGRIGEMVIYFWLRARLPRQDIDAAWRSTNALAITGREGSDSLGYDFEVSYQKQVWQIEVKSSLNDPCTFEMGETEVRAARAAARGRSGIQYRIAYVSNLSEPAMMKVELLPNPMTEEGESVLSLLGEGIRYGFSRM